MKFQSRQLIFFRPNNEQPQQNLKKKCYTHNYYYNILNRVSSKEIAVL
jgi:hypothetical protein